jgi:hypothetical protein
MEIFFDVANLYNVSIALALHEKWLKPKDMATTLGYVLLVPNLVVILTVRPAAAYLYTHDMMICR